MFCWVSFPVGVTTNCNITNCSIRVSRLRDGKKLTILNNKVDRPLASCYVHINSLRPSGIQALPLPSTLIIIKQCPFGSTWGT